MTRTRWKLDVSSILILPLVLTAVSAVSLSQCSSQNTGDGVQSSNSIYMTNGKCHDNCQGYAFAITQWQNCWCSNEAPGDSTSAGSCNQPCPGYPSEMCGNQQQGLYGYVALGKAPLGTMGAGGIGGGSSGGGSSSVPAPPSSSFIPPPPSSSPPPPPQLSTQVVVSSVPTQTVVQKQETTQISTIIPPSSSVAPIVVTQTQQTTETQISSVPPSTVLQDPSTSIVDGPTSTVTPTPLVVTSALATTVSGQIVTHFLTSTPSPSASPSSAQSNEMPKQTKTGLSSGAVAGVTIGAVCGVALCAALIFLALWRRKRNQADGDSEGAALKRNGSVRSRIGLLRNSNNMEDTGPTLPQIRTHGIPVEVGPTSAATMGSSHMSENRRNSRPLFSDQRLNPNALMTQTNLSRTSVSTLQDNQDYTRPLEVRNPDRPSMSRDRPSTSQA